MYLFSLFSPAGVNERVEDERVEECKARVAAWRATGRRGEPSLCRGGWVWFRPRRKGAIRRGGSGGFGT